METQPLLGRHLLLAGDGIVPKDLAQGLEHVAAFLRKAVGHLHELPATVGDAIGHDRLEALGFVA